MFKLISNVFNICYCFQTSISELINQRSFSSYQSCLCCLAYLFSVIEYAVMHEMRLIHTDLKPENILLVSPDYVKVPDYKVINKYAKCLYQVMYLHMTWFC